MKSSKPILSEAQSNRTPMTINSQYNNEIINSLMS